MKVYAVCVLFLCMTLSLSAATCAGTTKEGRPCKRMVRSGEAFCYQHKGVSSQISDSETPSVSEPETYSRRSEIPLSNDYDDGSLVCKGMRVKGTIVSSTPATVKIKKADNSFEVLSVNDMDLKSAAKVSGPNSLYRKMLDINKTTEGLISDANDLKKTNEKLTELVYTFKNKASKYVQLLGLMEKYHDKLPPEMAEDVSKIANK